MNTHSYLLPRQRILPRAVSVRPRATYYTVSAEKALPVIAPTNHERPAAADQSRLPPIFGRALRYDDIAELNSQHYYTFARGAFRGVEQIGHNVKMHFGHDPSKTLASTWRDTLRLYEHEDGLYFTSSLGSLADLIERGAVLGASIAFFSSFSGEQVRECLEGRVMHVIRHRAGIGLNEISICITGAPKYPGTWVATPHTPGVLAKLPKGYDRWEQF